MDNAKPAQNSNKTLPQTEPVYITPPNPANFSATPQAKFTPLTALTSTPDLANLPQSSPVNPSPPAKVPVETPNVKIDNFSKASTPSLKKVSATKGLLVAGPLLMFLMIGFSFYRLKLSSPQTQPSPPQILVEIKSPEDYERYAPDNPLSVKAYSDETKQVELVSGQVYNYPNPYFEWEEATIHEPGAKIVGYLVSFRTSDDTSEPLMIKTNHFSPQEHSLVLESGQIYILEVQSVSNGQASLGFDKEKKVPASQLFEYFYQ